MAILQFANNASSTLAQNITGVDTTIYLAAGEGSLFPTPTATEVFYATIYNTSSTLWEIVLVTARSGDVLTVIRAQEGTTAQTWLVGDSLGMYPTAATMNQLIQIDQLQQGTYNVVQAGGTANALTCQITSDLTSIPDGMTLVVKPVLANTGAATIQVTMGSTILPAVPIVKGRNLDIEATDIPSSGYPVQLIYSAIFGAWVMQMPATLITPPVPPVYAINYLIAAGGGGSSGDRAGGGGAGGVVLGTITASTGNNYTIFIGGGGTGGYPTSTPGTNSYITGIVTVTGGGPSNTGGGSGGGGHGSYESEGGNPGAGGFGITGQGNYGGNGGPIGAGGGGGGGSSGAGGGGYAGGAGGTGILSGITGTSLYYAGGGGGGGEAGGAGGAGGGGNGGSGNAGTPGNGNPGELNTGGGGGNGSGGASYGGNGGTGICILSMPTASYTGVTSGTPLVSTSGAFTILKYTGSGTYTA